MSAAQTQRLQSGAEASSSGAFSGHARATTALRPLPRCLTPFQRALPARQRRPTHLPASQAEPGLQRVQHDHQADQHASFDAHGGPAAPPATTAASPQSGVDGSDDVLIEFRNVHKSFGSKHILRGASFKIRRGEAVGIIGSSGTGKSTALRLAAGLLEPDEVGL